MLSNAGIMLKCFLLEKPSERRAPLQRFPKQFYCIVVLLGNERCSFLLLFEKISSFTASFFDAIRFCISSVIRCEYNLRFNALTDLKQHLKNEINDLHFSARMPCLFINVNYRTMSKKTKSSHFDTHTRKNFILKSYSYYGNWGFYLFASRTN